MDIDMIHKQLIKLCAHTDLPVPGELQSTFDELSTTLNNLIKIEGDFPSDKSSAQCCDSGRLNLLSNLRDSIGSDPSGGFVDTSVGFAAFPNEGVGLLAQTDIKAGQLLLKVPRSRMLTHTDALNCSAWQSAGLSLDPMCQRMPNTCLALYLLHHRLLAAASPHCAYINCLPTDARAAVCLTLSSAGYARLASQGVLRERILTELRNCCKQYLYFYRLLNRLAGESTGRTRPADSMPLLSSAGAFTYAAYRWAVAMVMSRNNMVPDGPNSTLALVPLWDMGNHRFGQMSTDYSLEERCLVFYAMEDAPAGGQVYFMYGQRSDADLLLYAGFCPERLGGGGGGDDEGKEESCQNPHDTADLRLGMNPRDRLIEAKTAVLAKLGMERSQVFHLPVSNPLSSNVLAFARLNCAQTDEEISLAATQPDSTDAKQLNHRAGVLLTNRFRLLSKASVSSATADNGHGEVALCDRFVARQRVKFDRIADVFQRWTDQFV